MNDISAESVPQLRTQVRGKLRRAAPGVRKEQLSLLAQQLKEGVSSDFLSRQLKVMQSKSDRVATIGTLGSVYFLASDDAVKIGFSTDVGKRINSNAEREARQLDGQHQPNPGAHRRAEVQPA
jgi:hypothetical protein